MRNDNPEIVQALVNENPEFKSLFRRHRELDKQVDKAGGGQLAISDESLEQMKLERLQIKDRMCAMVNEYQQGAVAAA